jgi:hypothetical protein
VPPDPTPKYTLLLTAIAQPPVDEVPNADADFRRAPLNDTPSEPSRQSRALIAELGSPAAFYRTIGDKVGEMTVTDIERGRVILRKQNGESTELALPHMSVRTGDMGNTRAGT